MINCMRTCRTHEALLRSALRAGAGGLGAVRAAIPLAAAVPGLLKALLWLLRDFSGNFGMAPVASGKLILELLVRG